MEILIDPEIHLVTQRDIIMTITIKHLGLLK